MIRTHTEAEYRKIPCLSYSSIKDFIKSPSYFYKKHILKDIKEDDPSEDMIRGQLVDCLLLDKDNFDNKFIISTQGELDPSKNQMNYFACKLWEKTVAALDEETGIMSMDFQELFVAAWEDCIQPNSKGEQERFKKKEIDYVVSKFEGTSYEVWYAEKRVAFLEKKTMVSVQQVTDCENIVNNLLTHPNFQDIFFAETGIEFLNQFPILFDIDGISIKSLVDRLMVNHNEKYVKPFDLKVSWELENFGYNLLKNFYYIQAATYNAAVLQWAMDNYPGYAVKPMEFIVADSRNFIQPLRYQCTNSDLVHFYTGFKLKSGKEYVGLNQAIQGLEWALNEQKWNITKKNHENNNIAQLNLQYE